MLRIQILGKGLIPRGLGLAPRKAPINADLTLIETILATPGLKVNMIHPDGRAIELTNKNLKKMWDTYRDVPPIVSKPASTAPVVPEETPVTPVEHTKSEPKVEVKTETISPIKTPEVKADTKIEEKKADLPIVTKSTGKDEKKK